MFLLSFRLLVGILLLTGVAVSPGRAAEMLAGPYRATVERVVDGDTLAVRVTVWLQQDVRVLVRVRGIDAPEMRGRCEGEKLQARDAAEALSRLVAGGEVVLMQIEGDKYYGRVVADVISQTGEDIGGALLANGMARQYAGNARQGWCEIGAAEGSSRNVAQAASPAD